MSSFLPLCYEVGASGCPALSEFGRRLLDRLKFYAGYGLVGGAVISEGSAGTLRRRKKPPTSSSNRTSSRLSREDWINAAKTMLVESGIDGVKVDLLAKRMKVTRGSFYWHFEDRDALLDALLHLWVASNTEPMLGAIKAAGARGDRKDFDATVGRLWIDETEFDPAFDSAIRDWARTDPEVAEAVHRIDDIRVAAFAEMFKSYGFAGDEAEVRGRIIYYHQVGYYTLGIRESSAERERLGALYDKVLLY